MAAGTRRGGEGSGGSGAELPTLHEQIEAVGWGRFQSVALAAFVLFVVSEAMEVTVPNVVWEEGDGGSAFGLQDSAAFRAVVVGAPMLGNLAGSVCGGVVADTYGRHAAIYLHTALFVAASLASGLLGQDHVSFIASRLVLGLSLGIIVPVVVSFMAEITPSTKRARAVVIIPGFGFPCGQILMFCIGLLLRSLDAERRSDGAMDGFEWRKVMLMGGIIPNLVAAFLVWRYVPESPHFLLSVGRHCEAEAVIGRIALVNGSEHRLLSEGRIGNPNAAPFTPHAVERREAGMAREGGAHASRAESRVDRWRRQGLELLSPPLHTYMLLILAMWMSAGFGQFGADIILPKILETALDLDVGGRLMAMLVIAICAWPSFLIVIVLLERGESLPTICVCAPGESVSSNVFVPQVSQRVTFVCAPLCAHLRGPAVVAARRVYMDVSSELRGWHHSRGVRASGDGVAAHLINATQDDVARCHDGDGSIRSGGAAEHAPRDGTGLGQRGIQARGRPCLLCGHGGPVLRGFCGVVALPSLCRRLRRGRRRVCHEPRRRGGPALGVGF